MKTLVYYSFVFVISFLVTINVTEEQQQYPRLLFANRRDLRVVDVTGPAKKLNTSILISHLQDATAVDWMEMDGKRIVCWSDIQAEKIECQRDGKMETIVMTNLPAPEDIAIDWLTSKIYWTDSETNRIEIVSILKPHYRSVLIYEDVDQPRAIVVAPSVGLLFWSDWGEWPKIETAGMDGTGRRILTDKDLIWPNGLSLDEENMKLYWVDAKLHYISYINFDGSGRSSLKKETSPHPFALVFSNGLLFWSDWNSNSLHWMRADGSTVQRTLNLRQSLTPMDLVLYENRPKLSNPCRDYPCSHLCLINSNKSFTCSCPTGIKKRNQTHCNDGIEEFLLVARGTEIRQISLDTDDYTDILLGFNNLKHVLAIDYDKSSGLVVWTDDEGRKIEGGPLQNSTVKKSIVASEIVHPDGLAVDQVSSNLYWTDAGTDRIEVCRLDGRFRRIIVSRGLQEPRAIAVDPNVGNLFWSDWGKKAKIERSNLDGTSRIIIVNTNILWPNGIALDFQSKTIYWCDGSTDKIEMASYSGSNRRTLIQENLPHTFGLTLVGDYIYWTDWQRRIIERANKLTGIDRRTIKDPFPDPMGLKGVSNLAQMPGQLTWNPCGHNNGGCLELCFWKEGHITCACRAGYELAPDNKTCVNPAAFLVFTQKSGDLHRMSLSRPFNDSNEIIPVSKVKQALAIGLDHVEGYVYWSDSKLKTISRGFINGSDSEKIVEWGLLHPESLAVDYISRNIYWTDMARSRIEVCKLDGSSRKILIWDVDSPKSIAVDHQESKLYFSTWLTSNPTIEKCNLDGSVRSTFTRTTGRVNSLAIDETHIYFANIDSGNVERVELSSREGEIVHRSVSNSFSLVAVYENYVYISDFTSNSILKASKNPNSQDAMIIATSVDIFDMSIYNKQVPSNNKTDFCKSNSCTHLCFNSESHSICSCPTHYKFVNNSCLSPKEFILLANNNSVIRLIFDEDECPDSVLLGGLKKLRGLTWNSNTGSGSDIIYCDSKGIKGGGAVGVGNLVGGGEFKSIAFDSIRGLLFYSREGVGSLNVSDGRGQWSGGIWSGSIQTGLPRNGIWPHPGVSSHSQLPSSTDLTNVAPIHITLSILTTQIYFAVSNIIHRVRYDGLQGIKYESDYMIEGVGVDGTDKFLFWTDSSGRLYRANLDFSNPIVLVADVAGIGQITVHGRHVYWLDSFRSLERVDKFTGFERARLLALDEVVVDLISVNDTFFGTLTSSHYCNNECSHICLENNVCACPVDLTLSKDGRTCGYKLACGVGEFECKAGSISCISNINKCNGIENCHDGSDEFDCCENYCSCSSDTNIGLTEKCPCWTKKQLCDGIKNCPDGIDELNCGITSGSGSDGDISHSKNTLTLFGTLFALILMIMAIILFYFKRRRKRKRREQLLRRSTPTAETLFHTTSASETRNPTPPSSASSPYCELLVPNPSPATEPRSCCNDLYYKQAPPPTPCSTDVCDESEIYAPPPSLHTSPSTVRSNKYLPPPPSPDLY